MSMITADPPSYIGYVTFCEDIREEFGGKVSYMGVYKGFLGIHSAFPVALPKFCFAVSFWLHKRLGEGSAKLWIFMPGDPDGKPSIEGVYPNDAIPRLEMPGPRSDPHLPIEYTRHEISVGFSPFIINQPGTIKVRIVMNDVIYRVGLLEVFQMPRANQPDAPTQPSV